MQRDLLLLAEMIEAAGRAQDLVAGLMLEDLQADRLRSEALLWNFTVMGEAATQLSEEVKNQFPGVPWQQPARLRNRIVHGYWSIDLEILHTTANDQLPSFADEMRNVLAVLSAEPGEASADPGSSAQPSNTSEPPQSHSH